jgi:hypothetical protein
MNVIMSFFGPFVATGVLTMASLGLIIVLRSDRAESDSRGVFSQLASMLGWLWAASMPIFAVLFVINLAEGAAVGGYDSALFGILGGTLFGFWILGRAALFPNKNSQANKP